MSDYSFSRASLPSSKRLSDFSLLRLVGVLIVLVLRPIGDLLRLFIRLIYPLLFAASSCSLRLIRKHSLTELLNLSKL